MKEVILDEAELSPAARIILAKSGDATMAHELPDGTEVNGTVREAFERCPHLLHLGAAGLTLAIQEGIDRAAANGGA
ncbi:MAG: hypothetical protein JWO41_237 [Candidatus Saccharibacteria bacterium]|nr:hypothetical protein [Candidatus Saccharibacteria bacterium]